MGITSAAVVEMLNAASEPSPGGAAGMAFQAVDKTGAILASGVSGYRDITTKEPITLDTVFWIASCSKLSTSIAIMQLVEQGKVSLDDADILAKTCPELAAANVLKDGEQIRQTGEKGRITLRMLLTHTAGLSYSFLWEEYWKLIKEEAGKDEFSGREEAFVQPLKFQPGTDREYAIGIDWVGIFIHRFTEMKLGEYMQQNMFGPIGMDSTAFEPTPDMRKRMTKMHTREGSDFTGKVIPRKHPLLVFEGETPENYFHSGGGGLLSTVQDYTKLLATIVNDGTSPYTSNRILQKSTIDTMFTNQIPQFRELYGTRGMDISRLDLASAIFRQQQPDIGPQGWGLSFQLLGEPEGESYSMATAPGICNCFWVMERKSGRAGMLLSQMLPLGDASVMGTWMGLVGKIFEP